MRIFYIYKWFLNNGYIPKVLYVIIFYGVIGMAREFRQTIWFYILNNQQEGPIGEAEIVNKFNKGILNANTLVWCKDMVDWERAEALDVFKDLFLQPPPVIKPPKIPSDLNISNNSFSKGRPWLRYLAKMLDYSIYSIILGLILIIIYPGLFEIPEAIFAFIIFVLCGIIDALILAAFGNSIGRAILKIKIRRVDGKTLRIFQTFKRNLSLSVFGLGLGIPLFSIATQYFSFIELQKNGDSKWDVSNGLTTKYDKLSTFRICFAIISLLLLISTTVFLNINDRLQNNMSPSELEIYEEAYNDGTRAIKEGYIYDDYKWYVEEDNIKVYRDGYYAGYIIAGGGSTYEYLAFILFNQYFIYTLLFIIALWIFITFLLIKKNQTENVVI